MKVLKFGLVLVLFSFTIILAQSSRNQSTTLAQGNDHQVWLPLINTSDQNAFTYQIDNSLQPSQPFLPTIGGGQARPVGVAVDGAGGQDEFVANEVIVYAESELELAPFLTRYNGQVLRDGTPFVPEGESVSSEVELTSSGWYLVQVDPQSSTLNDFVQNMEQTGTVGHFTFSSEDAARLLALTARESNAHINLLMYGDGQYNEHPDDPPNDYLTAESWWWMTEDDDLTTAVEEGLSVGVTHAWEYLRYHDLPPANWSPPQIAIIDGGFALDETTGYPLNNNLDFFPSRPWQADLVDYDGTAGGPNLLTCGATPCPWHGTGSFGVALARHSNQYGGAGTSGNIAWPMLFRIDPSTYTIANAIRSAAVNGADVISLSLGLICNSSCRSDSDINDVLQDAVDYATGLHVVVVAAAGNNGMQLDGQSQIPCELDKVICVGSVNQNGNNVFNFGGGVDIWAPTGVYSTVTPVSIASDSDDTGADEVQIFGGTSASTPFVAGIVSMMMALDPGIPWWEVQDILQDTANDSSDPTISSGYVDAHRALLAVRSHEPPTISITSPADNATLSYSHLSVSATAVDPETDDPESGQVEWYSDIDGFLCRVEGFYYAGLLSGCANDLTLGTHTITAIATDAHDATAEAEINLTFVNHPPTAILTSPSDGATYYNHQNVTLSAFVHDQDGPWDIEWHSNIDGFLGDTWQVVRQFTTGTHLITVTVTDELGLEAEDSITLNIIPGEGVPTITVLEPTDSTHFPDTPIDFLADVIDPEDGSLDGQSVNWYSNYDGHLGAGRSITASLSGPTTPCNPEYRHHTISIIAVDSDGHVIQEQFNLSVGVLC